ncbi:hypothetical protein CDV31_013772 [Fusarium ambrosium]|uniref:Uncharacterized protein n=1 Tax=Fusarium ambrosium TaxID=131363 RepID=A0A428T0W4_9HYPO|nr:hypothetical protein CDV31_013772 [Fusarium ambrosium]
MDWRSLLGLRPTTPACDTDDICALLKAVLPTFIAIAQRRLPDASVADEIQTFYLLFYNQVFNLDVVLVQWDPTETVQRLPADEEKVSRNLMRILDELENVFVSRKGEAAGLAFQSLGFKREQGETYPKLRALKRILLQNNAMNESFLNDVDHIMRIHKKSAEKRESLLRNLGQALQFFYNLQPFTSESDLPCPIRFQNYPLKHVRRLANTLFDVVKTNWCCQCPGSASHVSRNTRLNLTQHQRFDTTPARGQVFANSEIRFRLLFPTNSRNIEWQDTEISVTERDHVKERKGKDRLILSAVLTTTFLHFVEGPWLRANISSENICFLASDYRSTLDITKPYLTTRFTSLTPPPLSTDLSETHEFPDILSLGILLLEIAQGAPIEFEESKHPCYVALKYLKKWECSGIIFEGLHRAIFACLNPAESRGNEVDENFPRDFAARKYIFERVLYPLEDTLYTAYGIQLSMLHADIARPKEVRAIGSCDHQDEHRREKQEAAEEWLEHLDGVHRLFYECEKKCDRLREGVKKATRVKVAVLDTGLQLPGAFQENYEDAERIDLQQSATFIPAMGGEATHEWKIDCDGHGSRVGQIILQIAPTADLHIAKVFKTRNDLADPNMATQVHKRIAEAIDLATNEWKVDMIIMCFGFEEPIPLIRKAIDKASKAEKPPLFFAATSNDGAHKSMAWPAREMSVIGISSTTSDGSVSTFNPSENKAHSILYAFGEGVPVKVADPGNPDDHITEYVSGTSYATPVAAALAANLLGCTRMLVETCPLEDRAKYGHVPGDLQRMSDMMTVLRRHMQKSHVCGVESLIPWDFLNVELLDNNRILKDIANTLRRG